VFVAQENIVCILKWPSLIAKNRKTKKSKFGRIDSRIRLSTCFAVFLIGHWCKRPSINDVTVVGGGGINDCCDNSAKAFLLRWVEEPPAGLG
jgi:hypothetical protein